MNPAARTLLFISALIALSACSGRGDFGDSHRDEGKRPVYGQRDKQVARLLSVGEAGSNSAGSPQDQALLCDIALQAMSDQLDQTGALSESQTRALAKVQMMYRERAAERRTKAEAASSRRNLEIAHPDAAERIRIAIGCLRQLEG